MSKGSGTLGFGAGLARGLAGGMLRKSERRREDELRKADQSRQNDMMLLPFALKLSEESGDYSAVQQIMERIDPDLAKQFKKSGGSPFEMLAPILSPTSGQMQPGGSKPMLGPATTPKPSALPGPLAQENTLGPMTPTGEPTLLPSRQAVGPVIPEPARWSFGGTPLATPEERTARLTKQQIELERGKLTAQDLAKLDQAERLRQVDPSMSIEDALIAVGLKVPRDDYGVIPSGGGVLNKRTGEIVEPPSARSQNLPAQLRERVEELRSLNPTWSEAQLREAAAKAITDERTAEITAKEDARESLQATRDLRALLLKMQADQGGITPNNAASLTVQMRRDWEKAIKPFRDRQTYVAKLNEALVKDKAGRTLIQRDRNVATQTIVNSFNRLLEEQNAVREGEYARSEELAPLSTWLQAQLAAVSAGGGKLTDAQLTSIAREGVRIAKVTGEIYEEGLRELRTGMTSQLGRYKLPPEDVFGRSTLGQERVTIMINGKPFTGTQAQIDAYTRLHPEAK